MPATETTKPELIDGSLLQARYGADAVPAAAKLNHLESFMVATIDAGLAAQNAAVAAESMGLGTGYVGAMRNDPERVASELALPPRTMALFGMCVGRADPARPAAIKPRLPQPMVAFRERYAPHPAEAELMAKYDATLAAFSRSQGMGDANWSSRIFARMATLKGLNGRERMRAMMQTLGFELR